MAHNVSQEKRRRALLASPLSSWRGWQICAMERGGRHPGVIAVEMLLDRPDPIGTVAQMVAALRCVRCGASPSTILLRLRCESEDRWQPVMGEGSSDLRQRTTPRAPVSLPLEPRPAMELGTVRVEWWRGLKI